MNKAYIILAHKNAMQVKRLVNQLDDHRSAFFIHVDSKAGPQSFKAVVNEANHITYVKSLDTHWGGLTLVTATLNAMTQIKATGRNFERVILLSGQDYPIKSNEEIDQYFKTSPYKVFMDHFPLPNYPKWATNGGMYRVNKYYFGLAWHYKYAAKITNFLAMFISPLRRKLPNGMNPFAGSQWWIMDMPAVSYVLNFVERNPHYTRFHKYTFAPDELFFQMILLNSADQQIKASISADHLRFMKWESSATAHPEILRKNDFNAINNSAALFARKFDENEDPEILDMIDEQLLTSKIGSNNE